LLGLALLANLHHRLGRLLEQVRHVEPVIGGRFEELLGDLRRRHRLAAGRGGLLSRALEPFAHAVADAHRQGLLLRLWGFAGHQHAPADASVR
jgi:hypothetical protein